VGHHLALGEGIQLGEVDGVVVGHRLGAHFFFLPS
jgi:hypothetical protein